jgi:hypothetical protein
MTRLVSRPGQRIRYRNGQPVAEPASAAQQTATTKVLVTETLTLTPTHTQSRTDLLTPEEQWGWSEVRDYVVAQIEQHFGPFPRDARKEHGIFSRFCTKYGPDAGRIAKYAFDVAGGWWKGSPISVTRFCRASDPWFADVILERLNDTA